MEALKPTFHQTNSLPVKTAAVPVQGQAVFASLLESLNLGAELSNAEQQPAETLLENLSSLLESLQELSVEDQPAELQEIQYAVLQLQELQSEIPQPRFAVINQTVESAENVTDVNNKLIELLEKIQQKLQILTEAMTKEVQKSSGLAEIEESKKTVSFNEITQISKQLDELIGMLERKSQTKIGIEESKTLPEIPKFISEMLKPVKEIPKVPVDIQETPKITEKVELQPIPKIHNGEELQSPKILTEVKTSQEAASQTVASIATDASKVTGNTARTEASPQSTPFVRLENLLEDLGGMLKSSMRLVESQEGMKMRVNIFPEHLGHLEILLTSTNGKLAAQIMASTPMAKEAIELQLNQLRVSLVQQGVEVEKIEVLQQSSQQAFNQQQSQSGQRFTQPQQRNGKTHDNNGYVQLEDDKGAERQPLVGEMMKVDYTV
ncbi:hypothetical protein B481_3507 [Planococcus halocryophilus Or1]|uniref:Flagellar hook-length control protein FliK n=1 Tax=Planococcus halocryophilus TaxID=1215089 RepID=A0A1C7DTU7_9BACL|nr:flagellar hook-length control protein FliK [Planococcus halocryophilus]ANU14824.1 flagellar hook-length control protein FliK [Planococcus halocryophilus]EMF45201.1 hypothetical protein B481_3507 [Planococcus halocryophilus Or1]